MSENIIVIIRSCRKNRGMVSSHNTATFVLCSGERLHKKFALLNLEHIQITVSVGI